jgi:hypothetical protein
MNVQLADPVKRNNEMCTALLLVFVVKNDEIGTEPEFVNF